MKPPLTTEARKTPLTDQFCLGSWRMQPLADLAREFERHNQVLTEALEEAKNLKEHYHSITAMAEERCSRVSASEERLKDEIQALRKVAQYYAGECVNYDGGAYARIVLQGQSAAQRPTP